jgi:hypothetical protein
MTEPKAGDRVRVSYEATYEESETDSVKVRDGEGRAHFYYPRANVTIEVIEPAYEPGEVYQDANGLKYLRLKGRNLTWRPIDASSIRWADVGHDYPRRPLRKLVPEE